MNKRIKQIAKLVTGVVGVNILSMMMSAIMTLAVPKFIGKYEYSFWQLYVFYSQYWAYISLGVNDGLYLKLGGKKYEDLDKSKISSQFWVFSVCQIIISCSLMGVLGKNVDDTIKTHILMLTAFSSIIGNMRLNLQMILQAVGKVGLYIRSVLLENIILFAITMFMIISDSCQYKYMIITDIASRVFCLCILFYGCKEIVFCRIYGIMKSIRIVVSQLKDGIQLFLANVTNNLIIGIARFAIEQYWGTIVFGEISLILTLSNMIVNCVNAISIVLFPILRRTDDKKLASIYDALNSGLMLIVLGALCFYYPVYKVLNLWLPQYASSLEYFALLFPICVFDSKTMLLVNTYLKTLRKERVILWTNLLAMGINGILCLVSVMVFKNVNFVLLGISISLAIRCYVSELILTRILGLKNVKEIFLEGILVLIFMCSSMFLQNILIMITYVTFYLIYLIIKKKDIKYITSILGKET